MININISNKQFEQVAREARDMADVLRVIRHEYSNYDAAWQARPATEYRAVRIEFAKAFLGRIVKIDPRSAASYKKMMINWVNEK